MHNIDENEVLRNALSGLTEDVPPMPEELHTAWMQKVEEDKMEKIIARKSLTHFLSLAAALVFIIGGTLLTRDELTLRTDLAAQYNRLTEKNEKLELRAMTAEEYSAQLADYDALYGTYVTGTVTDDYAMDTGGFNMTSRAAANYGAPEAAPAAGMIVQDTIYEDAVIPETVPAAEKKIIRTANLTIQTQNYETSLTNLRALCEADGGWVESSSESTSSSTGLRTARLTLRIPQAGLDGYLAGAEQLGRITSRSETATDVTVSYQDTQTRLNTQLALMDRLQALITESGDLHDLLALESQIADTQYMIDSLQSSLNSTDRQVTYSTVSVTLREEKTPAITDTTVSLGERLAAALQLGCAAITDFAQDVLVFILAALPFIGVVVILAVSVIIIRKIRRNQK